MVRGGDGLRRGREVQVLRPLQGKDSSSVCPSCGATAGVYSRRAVRGEVRDGAGGLERGGGGLR